MYVSVAEGACQSSASQKWAKEKKKACSVAARWSLNISWFCVQTLVVDTRRITR